MDEKHDQTVAMLNDEKHLPRTRVNDNRSPLVKVIYLQKNIVVLISDFILLFFSVVQVFLVLFVIIYFLH